MVEKKGRPACGGRTQRHENVGVNPGAHYGATRAAQSSPLTNFLVTVCYNICWAFRRKQLAISRRECNLGG